jgi:cell division transport system permease protein
MKVIRILSRNIRDSFRSVFRNFALSLSSISSITITLLVMSLAILLTYNVNNFTTLVERDVTIVAFLDKDATNDDVEKIKYELNGMSNIEPTSILYKSKEDIKNEMMEASEEYEAVMSKWTEEENPLQDTYQIKVKEISKIGETASSIQNMDKIDIVQYGEGMVEQLVYTFEVVRQLSIVVVVALILVTAFLISNTIKITIFSRKSEIEIMRLVGASNVNIKIPFILEGLLLGLLGSVIPIIATIYGYNALYEKLGGQVFSPLIQLVKPTPFTMEVSVILMAIGVVVGMFGSLRAVRKYLKI